MIAATVTPPTASASSLRDLIISATPTQLSLQDLGRVSSIHLQWVSGTITVHHNNVALNPGRILSTDEREMVLRDRGANRWSLNEVYLSGGSPGSQARVIAYDISGSGSGFPTPEVWLKADAITGLVDNDPVALWIDSSGNNNDAAQATAAERPIYKTGIVNGLPIVRFDGVNDSLESPYSAISGGLPNQGWFGVFRTNNISAQQMIVWMGEANGNGFGFEFEIHSGIGDFHNPGNFVDSYLGGLSPSSTPGSDLPLSDTTNFHILAARFGDLTSQFTNTQVFLDGQAGLVVTEINGPEMLNWLNLTRIGRPNVATRFFNGDIAEIMIYDIDIAPHRASIEAYLKTKYNIPII